MPYWPVPLEGIDTCKFYPPPVSTWRGVNFLGAGPYTTNCILEGYGTIWRRRFTVGQPPRAERVTEAAMAAKHVISFDV